MAEANGRKIFNPILYKGGLQVATQIKSETQK